MIFAKSMAREMVASCHRMDRDPRLAYPARPCARHKLQTSGGDPSTFEPDIAAAGGVVVRRDGAAQRGSP